ncbi:divergent polysaccharide deacetylase family protein, partial [Caulobacter sp. 17J65-9]|nr:divergent polysaccharide deacetylase family protein [Caulobacter sp. 17J65-9]
MFAKRRLALAGTAAAAPQSRFDVRALLAFAKKPLVAPVGAGALFMGAAAVLLMVAADPRAGAPSVR